MNPVAVQELLQILLVLIITGTVMFLLRQDNAHSADITALRARVEELEKKVGLHD